MTRPAPPADASDRPAFRDGRVLCAADLRAETESRTAAAVRHQFRTHRPGVVAGLRLEANAIGPGMAIDAAGRTILVPATADLPAGDGEEVWLASRAVDDGYELLLEPAGRYDPESPDEHPLGAIFLGTVGGGEVGRVYVGAVGGRLSAGSGTVRVLLGPDGPGDTRLFAVSTPDPNKAGRFVDRMAYDPSDTLRLVAPVTVENPAKGTIAVVRAGHRPAEFAPAEIDDPVGLIRRGGDMGTLLRKNATPFELARLNERTPCDRLRSLLAGRLNALLDSSVEVETAARAAGAGFRPETVRLLLNRAAGLHRADDRRLARLLFEDTFPDELKRLSTSPDGPLGLAFTGSRVEPTTALPGRMYLAAVPDKAGPRNELRFEVRDPGKANNPQRYRFVTGTATGAGVFTPALTVDAGGTVTVEGDLRVFIDHESGEKGLLLRVKPTTADEATAVAADDGTELADQLAQVNPWALSINDVWADTIQAVGSKLTFMSGHLRNAGSAPIVGTQLHAVIAATDETLKLNPIRPMLLDRLVIEPKGEAKFHQPGTTTPLAVDISELPGANKLLVIVHTIGVGPGNIQTTDSKQFVITRT